MFSAKEDGKSDSEIVVKRKVNKVTKRMTNEVIEPIGIENEQIPKKYSKYNTFVECLRQELERKIRPVDALFRKDKDTYFLTLNAKNGEIFKLKNKQNCLEIWTLPLRSEQTDKKTVKRDKVSDKSTVISQLTGKSLLRYMKRVLGDSFMQK